MKTLVLSGLMLIYFNGCYSQVSFNEFVKKFNTITLPIENILELNSNDTLNGKLANDILFRNQDKKPQLIDKNGKLTPIKQYYGLYPEKPFKYFTIESKNDKWIEVEKYFINKIVPIGQIKLNPNYTSLIIKVIAYETTFYDLWNFTKDGKVLSVVCLFWGMRDAGQRDEKVTFTIVDSKITKESNIIWHENADGLETFRTYRLNDEGYFQIIEEEQKGESEF